MATQPEEKVDDFDAAFASFATGKDPAADTDAAGDSGEPAEESGDNDGGDSAPAAGAADDSAGSPGDDDGDAGAGDSDAGGAAAEGDDPGAEEAAPAAGEVEEDDSKTDELIDRLARLVRDAPEKEDKPAAKAAEETPDVYNEEEKQLLKTYEEDWADVSKGEALKRRSEYRDIVGYVFQEVAKQLQPLMEQVEVLATRTHLSDLQSRVEDYDTVRDKVISWVDKQPAYLQAAYKQVIQAGTADEVADLISRYRQSTGDPATPAARQPKKVVELSDDAKKAAEALAPVDTKRSTIPQDDGLGDFDSAFKRFAAATSK